MELYTVGVNFEKNVINNAIREVTEDDAIIFLV